MSLKDDLIAAKALIDSPEKWQILKHSTGSAIAAAFYGVTGDDSRVDALFQALHEVWLSGDASDHDRTLNAFDRAIEAAP